MSHTELYLLKLDDPRFTDLKIGVSGKGKSHVQHRIRELNRGTRLPANIIHHRTWSITNMDTYLIEQHLHSILELYNTKGEWFDDPKIEQTVERTLNFLSTNFGLEVRELNLDSEGRPIPETKKVINNSEAIHLEHPDTAIFKTDLSISRQVKKLIGFTCFMEERPGMEFNVVQGDNIQAIINQKNPNRPYIQLKKRYSILRIPNSSFNQQRIDAIKQRASQNPDLCIEHDKYGIAGLYVTIKNKSITEFQQNCELLWQLLN